MEICNCKACNRSALVEEFPNIEGWVVLCSNDPCPVGRAAIGATREEAIRNWEDMQMEMHVENFSPCVGK